MADFADAASLKAKALELGFTTVGVCLPIPPPHFEAYREWISNGLNGTMAYLANHLDLRSSPLELLPSARSVIAVTLNYNQPLNHKSGAPKIARYALGRDYHRVLRTKLRRLETWIKESHSGADSRVCVDSAPILEREYAHMAGLGWFGKNTCLIDSKRGSWFFIGLLLSSVPYQPDEPSAGGCGTCRKCIDACPTGAIVKRNETWQVDARRCISYLTIEHKGEISQELAEKVGDWTFGCDICQEVCPFNEPRASQPLRALLTEEPGFLNRRDWPSLSQLTQIPVEDWEKITPGSPVRRAGHEGLKRNAKINLASHCSEVGSPLP